HGAEKSIVERRGGDRPALLDEQGSRASRAAKSEREPVDPRIEQGARAADRNRSRALVTDLGQEVRRRAALRRLRVAHDAAGVDRQAALRTSPIADHQEAGAVPVTAVDGDRAAVDGQIANAREADIDGL